MCRFFLISCRLALLILAWAQANANAQCVAPSVREGSPFVRPLALFPQSEFIRAREKLNQEQPQLKVQPDFWTPPTYPRNPDESWVMANTISGIFAGTPSSSQTLLEGEVEGFRSPYRFQTERLMRMTEGEGGRFIFSEPVRVEGNTNSFEFKHGEWIEQGNLLHGDDGEFVWQRQEINTYRGLVSRTVNAEPQPFRGVFAQLATPEPQKRLMAKVVLTTCPLSAQDWSLSAQSIEADEERGIGEARHSVLRLGGVPIFYWPWMDFPLQGQRKSGFLMPRLTQIDDSKQSGYELALPYYFNLAPHYDWLLTPIHNRSRGWRIANEARYLGADLSGQALLNLVPRDKVFTNPDGSSEQKRYRLWWRHEGRWGSADYSFLWNKTSDINYLQDYADDPAYLNTTINLPREWRVQDSIKEWPWSLAWLDYQTLTRTPERDKPYIRAPYLTWASPRYTPSFGGDGADERLMGSGIVSGETTVFRHAVLPDINRTFVYPRWQWQSNEIWGFVGAQIGVHASRYTIRHSETETSLRSQNRVLPITKASWGLIFERPLTRHNEAGSATEAESSWLQTLEPSLYWLYIPFRDQSTLPVLDTARATYSFGQNDVDNNFTGYDRIADTHQITINVANRFYDASSRERFALEFGQRLFLKEQKVVLPGEDNQKKGRSDFFASAKGLFDHWRLQSSWRHDSSLKKTSSVEALIGYQPDESHLVGVRYNYALSPVLSTNTIVDSAITQTVNLQKTLEGVIDWPINRHWTFTGRNYYAINDKLYLETHVALRYQSCCVAVTLYRTNELLAEGRRYRKQWGLQFSLMGLTRFGNQSDEDLDRAFQSFRVQ